MNFIYIFLGPTAAQHGCVGLSCRHVSSPWLRSALLPSFEMLTEGTKEMDFPLVLTTNVSSATDRAHQVLLAIDA